MKKKMQEQQKVTVKKKNGTIGKQCTNGVNKMCQEETLCKRGKQCAKEGALCKGGNTLQKAKKEEAKRAKKKKQTKIKQLLQNINHLSNNLHLITPYESIMPKDKKIKKSID
ncbi:hypothetical protein RFI_26843 [Reticulomyxa filosa]|uniref:Uncharacterized protein n=1 Tax=Reticulomyxa filosa TaxID=46433 RepID=X6M954_RETFI|nr:hypothetical protein RFI_26843 [Reticulomyxa filosa]|eukprot:ETO10533.1 hypothetical protein RFI_26843 [Reticulomyxa filosa]